MTETQTTVTPTGKKKRTLAIVIAVLVVAVAAALFIISRTGFDQALVKQKLDEYIAAAHERALTRGRDLQITYKDLEVVGGFTNRHVVIHDFAAVVKPSKPQPLKPGEVEKPDSLTITTSEVLIFPTSVDLSSMRLSLTQPLNFAATETPEKSLLKIVGDKPLDYAFAQSNKAGVPYLKVDHTAPGFLDLTYLREEHADGAEDATPTVVPVYDTLHVTFTPNSTLHADVATDDSGLGAVDVDYKQITITPQSAPEGVVTLAGIQEKWSATMDAKGVKRVSLVAEVGPLTGPEGLLPYAPISLGVDANYVAVPPKPVAAPVTADATTPTEAAPDASTILIKKLDLKVKDASLSATADFKAMPGDILPSGKAEIKLVNLPFVRASLEKNNLLKPENEGWLAEVLTRITGTPYAELKDVTIPIERAQGGAFKVGNSSFEEIFAIFLKGMMSQRAGNVPPGADVPPHLRPEGMPGMPAGRTPELRQVVPVPTLPAADKPKPAPIAVPDNGVRG